jgi:16S rRNA A1518/A1519 N6-dimethyltransferase RsmA/KsgA/DIM1 with predicted DNA glycosylase/AP lyase activity
MKLFSEVVNLFIGHRRKMLKSCTKFAQSLLAQIGDWQNIFEHLSINPRSRPEQLSPEGYIAIANLCSDRLKSEIRTTNETET